jgi:hypothetical protein
MSVVNGSECDAEKLELYLLGLLDEHEAERLDELSITDDGVARCVDEAENDLIDAYVCDELSGERLDRFMSSYLMSPVGRVKIEVGRALLRWATLARSGAGQLPRRCPPTAQS